MSGTTPNIGLNVPDYGDQNWDIPVNQNWNTLDTAIAGKQATLVSGTNIKTVNSQSLLGSGNIVIDSLPTQTGQSGKFLTTNGTNASWAGLTICHVVVETYINGTYWYRVWSDGWIETGMTETVGSKTSKTCTFAHAFSDTNYVIECTQTGDGTSYNNAMGVVKTSATQFTVNNAGGGSTNTFYIYACGY